MLSFIAYCIFILVVLLIDIILIYKKGLKMIDYLMLLSTLSAAGFGDRLFVHYFHLYYYVNKELNLILSLVYIFFVYSACGLWFSLLFPKTRRLKQVSRYVVKWIVFLLLVETLIIKPFEIIKYTAWRIFPHSLVFFLITLPLFAIYYLVVSRYFKDKNNQ
jgi:hypothetical protein